MLIKVWNVFIEPMEIDHYECGSCGVVYDVQPANLPGQCIVCNASFEQTLSVAGDGT